MSYADFQQTAASPRNMKRDMVVSQFGSVSVCQTEFSCLLALPRLRFSLIASVEQRNNILDRPKLIGNASGGGRALELLAFFLTIIDGIARAFTAGRFSPLGR